VSTATAISPPLSPDALYEVVDGVVVELPPMSTYSQLIAFRIGKLLDAFVQPRHLGIVFVETLLILDAIRNLRKRPDVAFVSQDRSPGELIPERGDWEVVPDLAVEVTSPGDLYDEVMEKVQDYFRYGVLSVWVVWPLERQVYIYHAPTKVTILTETDTLEADGALAGLQIPLLGLFQRSLN
jgi:Uma2 family endonuclease